MKRLASVLILLVMVAGSALAQRPGVDVGLKFPQFSLLFHPQPATADAATLPLVEGSMSKGKERFGIMLRSAAAGSPVIEILDAGGSVLKGLSVNDLLGKSTSGVKLVSSHMTASNRRAENIYNVTTPQGAIQLVMKVLATGDSTSPAQQRMIMTFAVRGSSAQSLALRLNLPVQGTVETRTNGFVVAAKNGAGALSAAVYPKGEIVADKGTVAVTGGAVGVTAEESALLWIVFEGSTAATAPAAKLQASGALDLASKRPDNPNLLIISSTDRTSIRPSDTVALTLICVNVGTKGASGVTLKNPVPPGTAFMDGSATGEGTEVLYDREAGTVRNVKWKMTGELKPGDEQVVSFKAVVQ
jgi:uncharacterized repeat protein (TIGR01451 family)